MKIVSFFLSFIITSLMLGGLFLYLFYKKPQKKVFIHTAIIAPKESKINRIKKVVKKKIPKKNVKKGSKSSITKSGDIDFNDIFKNVNYNVKTDKVKLKKNDSINRLKGIKQELENLKINELKFKVADKKVGKKNLQNEVLLKLQKVWNEISDIVGEYAKIRVNVFNNRIEVVILKTNLSLEKQKELISKIEALKFKKNFSLLVTFQTKVNK